MEPHLGVSFGQVGGGGAMQEQEWNSEFGSNKFEGKSLQARILKILEEARKRLSRKNRQKVRKFNKKVRK